MRRGAWPSPAVGGVGSPAVGESVGVGVGVRLVVAVVPWEGWPSAFSLFFGVFVLEFGELRCVDRDD